MRTRGGDPPKTGHSGVILSKERRRKAAGVGTRERLRSGWSARFTVQSPLRYNFDQRWLVNFISLRLAAHYRDSLKRGVRADGFGRLPKVDEKTLKNDAAEGRLRPWVGMRTGWMAEHWWVGKVAGSGLKSSRLIKPNGSTEQAPERKHRLSDKGRGDTLDKMLDRKKNQVDFQSVRGAASRVIQKGVADALPLMVGHKIGVPANVDRSAGTIDGKTIL